jgi:predicted DNA-binding transcriptional regulator AlpA
MKRKSEYLARVIQGKRDLVTASEIAGQFAVTPRTIWAWVARGDFPEPTRIGPRCRRWSISELQRWVDDGCPRVASDLLHDCEG